MKLLLDEDAPEPWLPFLKRLLLAHTVDNVASVNWKSKKDTFLYPDAARRGYQAVLTNDLSQLNDPDECDAIQRSKLHWIAYALDEGLDGLGRASGAVFAAIVPLVEELEGHPAQQIVHITSLAKRRRYEITDPSTDPPSAYWRSGR